MPPLPVFSRRYSAVTIAAYRPVALGWSPMPGTERGGSYPRRPAPCPSGRCAPSRRWNRSRSCRLPRLLAVGGERGVDQPRVQRQQIRRRDFRRSRTGSGKLVTKTSAGASSRCSTARPSACFRSRRGCACYGRSAASSSRLFRDGVEARQGSPAPGGSILMTSAPKSERMVAAAGPAIQLAQSRTFRPVRRSVMSGSGSWSLSGLGWFWRSRRHLRPANITRTAVCGRPNPDMAVGLT